MNFCSHLISISIVVWILGTTVVAANTESKAIDLDDSTFATTIREYSLALVKFYAPWCGHCKNLAPIYDEAAEILQDSSIVLIRVNAEENSKLAREYNVSGYPTLLIFRNGIAEPYEGPRDSGQQIADFLKAETEPVSEVLPSAQFLNEIRKKYQSTTTLLIGLLTNHSDKIVFDQVLRKIKFFKGFYTTSIEVMNDLGYYSEKSTVLTFQMKSNSKRVVFRNKLSFQSLLTHVINAGMPRLYVLQPEHANLIRLWEKENPNSVVVHVYVSVESTNPELDASIIPKIDEMTQGWTHLGKGESRVNQLVVIPTDITEFSAHTFNFSKSDIASYHAATLHADQQIYSLPTGIELKDFYSAFLEKRLRPHIKSQPIPQDIAEKGNVVEVVGLTFEHLVQDPEKNVLIEFYAPWCGHCKALEPKYNQVAQMLADEEDVRIARIDATNNEVPKALQSRYHFTGFPTIFWVPRGESKNLVKTYEGSRTAEEIVAWILQNLKNKSST